MPALKTVQLEIREAMLRLVEAAMTRYIKDSALPDVETAALQRFMSWLREDA